MNLQLPSYKKEIANWPIAILLNAFLVKKNCFIRNHILVIIDNIYESNHQKQLKVLESECNTVKVITVWKVLVPQNSLFHFKKKNLKSSIK